MRLHTDFHDYYDNSIGFGVDENVHYNRFTKEIDIVLKTKNDRPTHRNSGLLGYCGYTFPFIKLHKWDKRYRRTGDEAEPKLLEICFAYNFETYKEKESDWFDYSNDFGYWDRTRDVKLKQFFVDWTSQNDAIFCELKVPIWIMKFSNGSTNNGIANPRLKDYQFERIKDSTTAFQEISMYLSNILVEQKEIAVIEDKYRIQQHGFDLKDSFRNTKKRKER
jgi:hypothetical protein